MALQALLTWISTGVAAAAIAGARVARANVPPARGTARILAVAAGAVAVAAGILAVLLTHPLLAAPMVSAAVVLGAGWWCLRAPAAPSFRQFERAFWEHVREQEQLHARD